MVQTPTPRPPRTRPRIVGILLTSRGRNTTTPSWKRSMKKRVSHAKTTTSQRVPAREAQPPRCYGHGVFGHGSTNATNAGRMRPADATVNITSAYPLASVSFTPHDTKTASHQDCPLLIHPKRSNNNNHRLPASRSPPPANGCAVVIAAMRRP